jgi:hypothetical protein
MATIYDVNDAMAFTNAQAQSEANFAEASTIFIILATLLFAASVICIGVVILFWLRGPRPRQMAPEVRIVDSSVSVKVLEDGLGIDFGEENDDSETGLLSRSALSSRRCSWEFEPKYDGPRLSQWERGRR